MLELSKYLTWKHATGKLFLNISDDKKTLEVVDAYSRANIITIHADSVSTLSSVALQDEKIVEILHLLGFTLGRV